MLNRLKLDLSQPSDTLGLAVLGFALEGIYSGSMDLKQAIVFIVVGGGLYLLKEAKS